MKYIFLNLLLILITCKSLSANNSFYNIELNENSIIIHFSDDIPKTPYFDQYLSIDFNEQIITFKYAADENHSISTQPKINVSQKFLGFRRNVPIYEMNVSIFDLKNLELIIDYEKVATIRKSNFTDDLINSDYSFSFSTKTLNKNSNQFQAESWFDKAKEYVLIETKQDAPVVVNANDIINANSVFNNKSSTNIHLIHKGENYPIYIEDLNGVFDNQDKIYFLAKKAKGDSTDYDFYTSYESFYLVYDENISSNRLALETLPTQAQKSSDVVNISKFIQIHEQYYDGHSYLTEKVETEGWMSMFFNPNEGRRSYVSKQFIFPDQNINNKVKIKVNYLAISKLYNNDPERSYNFNFVINDELYSSDQFTGRRFGSFDIDLQPQELISGNNKIELKAMPLDDISQSGFAAVQSIEISGNQKPFTNNGVISFQTEEYSAPTQITIPGFSSENLILIDNIRNSISFPKSVKKSFFAASGIKNENGSILSVTINNNIVSNESDGLLIAYLNQNSEFESKSFENVQSPEILEYLLKIPENSIVSAVFSSEIQLTSNVLNEFQNLGAKSIANSSLWAFSVHKGSTKSFEKIGVGSLSLSNYYENNSEYYTAELNLPAVKNSISLADIKSIENPIITSVSNLLPSEKIDDSDVIIIAHTDFLDEAEEYKTYRESNTEHKINIIDVKDIYKEFNFGKISPYAIKEYLKYNYAKNPNLEYVILFGDASWDPNKFLNFSISTNYIPVYGFPYSDYWYGLLDDDYEFELKVGRIPINNRHEFDDYMQKVRIHDSIPARTWMKDFLLLSGGENGTERRNFRNAMLNISYDYILPKPFSGDTILIAKQDEIPGSELLGGAIREQINKGKLWTAFLGHAAADVYDLEGWQVERLNNKDRYGILTTLSCNTGDFANPLLKRPRNEAYIIEPDKGYVISMGSTTSGFVEPHSRLLEYMLYSVSNEEMKYRNIIDILYYGKSRLYTQLSFLYTRMHYSLLGDPLLNIRVERNPEPFIQKDDLEIIAENDNQINDKDSNLTIKAFLHNNGTCLDNPLKVLILHRYNSIVDSISYNVIDLCYRDSLEFKIEIFEKQGNHTVEIILDPNNDLINEKKENNRIQFSFDVLTQGLYPLEPLSYWNVKGDKLRFRVIDQLKENSDNRKYNFIIAKNKEDENSIIYYSSEIEIEVSETNITWEPNYIINDELSYWFGAYYVNSDNSKSETLWIPFNSINSPIENSSNWKISTEEEFKINSIENLLVEKVNEETKVQILNKIEKVDILSYSGNPKLGDANPSYISIDIDDNTYVDGFYLRGFNIVTIPIYNNGEGGKIKRFDTWGNELSYGSDWWKDSVAIDLVDYLRDSVRNDEYLLVGTCNAVWRMPLNHKLDTNHRNQGSLDTLKYELGLFGSALIDSVEGEYDFFKTDWKHAYAMVGRKGYTPGTIAEGMSPDLDSVFVNTEITRYSASGKLISQRLGPASEWKKFNFSGFVPSSDFEVIIKIFGIRKSGKIELIKSEINQKEINLSDVSATEFPFISFEFELIRNNFDVNSTLESVPPYINQVNTNYSPTPEIAILNSSFEISADTVLRGENVEYSIDIKNISGRVSSDEIEVLLRMTNPEFIDEIITIPALDPDEIYTISKTINTASFNGKIGIYIEIDPNGKLNELYSFNNTYSSSFDVIQDKIKPVIELLFDGKQVSNGDFVQIRPKLQIKVSDNSPLSISNSENIIVFINSKFTDEKNAEYYNFTSYENEGNLKATLELIPNEDLEFGDDSFLPSNSFRIIAFDASGNSDTLRVLVNVSLNTFISELINYPNPFSNQTTIKFDFKAPDNSAMAIVKVYDMQGRFIKEFQQNATIGINEIIWDAKTNHNVSLSPGIYFYKVHIEGFFAEPVYGKMIYVN